MSCVVPYSASTLIFTLLFILLITLPPLTTPLRLPIPPLTTINNDSTRRTLLNGLTQLSTISLFDDNIQPDAPASSSTPYISPIPSSPSLPSLPTFRTRSGLEYTIFSPPPSTSPPPPPYGSLVTISYTLSCLTSSTSPLQKVSPPTLYLLKLGSGRVIPGLDEGISSMRPRERRRITIPPKLGYAAGGGPIPENFWERNRLNKYTEEMGVTRYGRYVFDVEMVSWREDEGDLGYYGDRTVEVEEFERLKENMRMQGGKEVTEKFEGVQGEGTVLQPDRRNVEKVR
ncbi:hypothetical protein TrST_g7371 [Triparma strigata]|uniref:peptidylprolyl isomerase n=1 Tax=Triparma strigata TaxID=1606541 RepID=A0A9W7BZ13_9STRA|nr:hypothetical protein TrST_g7371 [Triparma strigata]